MLIAMLMSGLTIGDISGSRGLSYTGEWEATVDPLQMRETAPILLCLVIPDQPSQ